MYPAQIIVPFNCLLMKTCETNDLHDVPGRPVIQIAVIILSILSKLKSLGKLPDGAILCTIDIVGLYPNIPHSEGLTSLPRFLQLRDNNQISSNTLIELAEIVLKTAFLNSMKKLLDR